MRANLSSYEMKVVSTLDDVLAQIKNSSGEWKPFAGGTDLMVLFEAGKLSHKKFVNIWGLPELTGIEVTADEVRVGALTTYSQIREHEILKKEFPMLCQAARETGAIAIQNRGTIGGNIANASPAADSPPALLAYDSKLELVSSQGVRTIDYGSFHLGYKKTALRPDEILSKVILPRSKNRAFHCFRKVGTRKAQAISKVCIAALAESNKGEIHNVRIVFGSIAPTVLRCTKTESVLKGRKLTTKLIQEARAELQKEITPIDDIRSTSLYRKTVAANLLEDFLQNVELGR